MSTNRFFCGLPFDGIKPLGLLLTAALQAATLSGCLAAPEDAADPTDGSDVAADESSDAIIHGPPGSPVAQHGYLRVHGNRIIDKHGNPVQLRGMSLYWSQWGYRTYDAQTVRSIAKQGASVIRAAMATGQDGYAGHSNDETAKIKTIVDAAIANGIYVIIDWHSSNAVKGGETQLAKDFFYNFAKAYRKYPNVLFEIYNEPVDDSWAQVKSYAENVIGGIRAAGSGGLVIVGSPHWSQDVDAAANDPITTDSNVAYTLHFYAASHKQWLRDRASYALNTKKVALFVTEWGTCTASGNGTLDLNESNTWLDFLKSNGVSWANWSLSKANESCAALNQSATDIGPWPQSTWSTSGKYVFGKF